MESIPVAELNQYLARLFLSVRSQKNEEYEPDSLKSIQSSISRYLMEKNGTNILQDKEFHHSREVLAAKRKHLKSQGLGNKKRKADPFTSTEIDLLFEKNLLGTSKFLKYMTANILFWYCPHKKDSLGGVYFLQNLTLILIVICVDTCKSIFFKHFITLNKNCFSCSF